MKIYCIKEELESAVNKADKIVGKNLSIPVLNHLLFEATERELIIKSTNLELGLEVKISAKTEGVGVFAIPGSVIKSFLSNIKDDKLTIELKDNNVFVKTKTSSTTIKTHPHDDFPPIPKTNKTNSYSIHAKDILQGVKSVWYAAAQSSIKPELSSVCLYEDRDGLVFVATDSFRLAEKHVRIKKVNGLGSILIPSKNITEIIRILELVNDTIEVSVEKNQISFESKGLYLMSRVIDGSFPDYKQIIPKDFVAETVCLRQDFIDALKLSQVFSDTLNQLSFSLGKNNKEFTLTSINNDVGESIHTLSAKTSGQELDIKFNFKYISESLQSIASDSITIRFAGAGKPAIIQGTGDDSFLYLVMPMNR